MQQHSTMSNREIYSITCVTVKVVWLIQTTEKKKHLKAINSKPPGFMFSADEATYLDNLETLDLLS